MASNGSGLIVRPLAPLAQALTNLFQPPPNTIRGIETTDWFGPLQPVRPIAPAGTEPRGFQYLSGQNLLYTPRAEEEYTAIQLRAAARYPLARVLIENVKDAVSRLPINVRLRRMPGESAKDYAKRKPDTGIITAIAERIENPNPEHNRQEFMRRLMEDLLVIDAPCVLFRTTQKKELMELRTIDGATITRYIDEQGFTPLAPSPAYAQLWYGIPMVDLSTSQLLYGARNILPDRLYGYSPTAQAIDWIRIGAERLRFKTTAYTDGTIPDGIQVVPPGIASDKILEAQLWMNSDLAGNLAKRRQLRLIQGFAAEGKEQIIFPKEVLLADSYDELEINCFCFAYGVSKQRLAKMMNRASAQSDQEAADKEGLEPWLDWAAAVWNKIIQKYLGFKAYEAVYDNQSDIDPMKDAEIHAMKVQNGRETVNEWREADGDEPRTDVPEADQLGIITATGFVPLSIDQEVERTKKRNDAMPTPEPAAPGAPAPTQPKKKLQRIYRY